MIGQADHDWRQVDDALWTAAWMFRIRQRIDISHKHHGRFLSVNSPAAELTARSAVKIRIEIGLGLALTIKIRVRVN